MTRRKSKKRGKAVSALALSELLGRDRGSLVRWAENDGMPAESRPDASGAGEWTFYTAEVVDWLIERETKRAVENLERVEMPSDNAADAMTVQQAELMKARWDAVKSKTSTLMQILALQKESEDLIDKNVVGAVVGGVLARARLAFGNLDARVSARVPDVDKRIAMAAIVREEVEAICAEIRMPATFSAPDDGAPDGEEVASDDE